MKIMIVDDHAEMRRMLRSVVAIGAVEPVEMLDCADGEEAVRQYEAWHPDHVLMDVNLRDMNGFTATERILENHPDASVIFVSSHDTSAYRTKARLMKAKGFVSKDNLSELDLFLQKR